MTFFTENGSVEPKSATATNWGRIDSQAGFTKKKIKVNFSYNKVFRQPGECFISEKTLARKAATAAKIEKMKRAAVKYKTMAENPESKIDKNGDVVVQKRKNGKFLPKTVLISAE